MDFLFRNLEVAQAHAKQAASSAKGFAQQVSAHTQVLAEQASSLSSAAAEQATQGLKSLHLADALNAGFVKVDEGAPCAAELQEYAITPDFREFVRSLTYSTFRDFPSQDLEQRGDQSSSGSGQQQQHYLTPWQERHATLVVLAVKEINELRFVLCPKRMTDEQFWRIYFMLARKYLPEVAFQPASANQAQMARSPIAQGPTTGERNAPAGLPLPFDLKANLQQLSASARQWSSQASAGLKSASGGGLLGSTLYKTPTGPAEEWEEAAQDSFTACSPTAAPLAPNKAAAFLDAEPGREVHLHPLPGDPQHPAVQSRPARCGSDASEAVEVASEDAAASDGASSGDGGSGNDDEFERYFSELQEGSAASAGGMEAESESGSGEDLDLDAYMQDLAAQDAEDG